MIEHYRRQARAAHGSATPFRVGYFAGLAADMTVRVPPRWTAHAVSMFEQGRTAGLDQRARDEGLVGVQHAEQ